MFWIALVLLSAAPETDCRYDRDAFLALDQNAFDQDLSGGWRALQERGCIAEAADLIRDYRSAKPRPNASLLSWHEGQLRAMLRQDQAAIDLFDASRNTADTDFIGWNHYVDGSIAFLRRDRAALQKARDTLAALPRPANLAMRIVNGISVPVAWPLNLNVLDGFLKCFDLPYKEAYGTPGCSMSRKVVVEDQKPPK